jgi:hypothetical protein
MVQCLPILRTLVREIHTTMTSKKLDSYSASTAPKAISYATSKSTTTVKSSNTFGSKTATFMSKRSSMTRKSSDLEHGLASPKRTEVFALREIPEEQVRTRDTLPPFAFQGTTHVNHSSDSWPLPASQGSDNSRGSMSVRSEGEHDGIHSYLSFDSEEDVTHGLSPPPSHRQRPRS